MSGTSVLRANTKNRWKGASGNFGARKAGAFFSFGTLALFLYLAAHQASDGLLSASPKSVPLTLNPSVSEAAAVVRATSSPEAEAQVKEHGLEEHGLKEHGLKEHGLKEHGSNEHGLKEHGLKEQDSQVKEIKERTTPVEGHEMQLAAVPIFIFMTEVKTSVALLLNITATFNPEAPLYMLTSSQTPPADVVLEELKRSGVKVFYYNPKPEAGSDVDIFRRHYVHRSANEEWYEMMCFERFLILEKVALQEGVERLFYFDADTVLFKELRETPYRRHEDRGFVGLTHLSSYNALWRIEVLQQFCKYLLYFYKRPVEEIDVDIKRWGDMIFPWYADAHNDSQKIRHFSDMYLISAFLQTHPHVSRILLLHEEDLPLRTQLIAIDHPLGLRYGGDSTPICDSVANFERYVEWRLTDKGLLAPYYNNTALAGLQFEGHCKKHVMPYVLGKIFPERPATDFLWL